MTSTRGATNAHAPRHDEAPLEVALLSPCYWPEVRRGSERFVHDLATGLLARGHRPRLVTAHPGRPSRTVQDGVPVTRLWRPPDGRLRRRGYPRYLTHVPFEDLALRRAGDDIVHAVYPTDALAAARFTRRSGRPSVFSVMGVVSHEMLMAYRGWLETFVRATRDCSATVALSHAAAGAIERWLGVEARVIAPGVDTDVFTPASQRTPEPTIICAAAVGETRKRVPLLIDAFRLVRRERPDARLWLDRASTPPTRVAEMQRIPGLELRGFDDRTQLARDYGAAWVSALPATGEAFGLVLAEALACGTPAVGTADAGIPEIVDSDRIGRLVDPGEDEPARLARALLEGFELTGDSSTRGACRARALALSTDVCAEAHVDLYRDLIARD